MCAQPDDLLARPVLDRSWRQLPAPESSGRLLQPVEPVARHVLLDERFDPRRDLVERLDAGGAAGTGFGAE